MGTGAAPLRQYSRPSSTLPDLVSQVMVRRMKKAGIGASIHSLRHSHSAILLSHGVPLPAVSARLGHADVNITAKIYAHALPDDDRRAADTWDSLINLGGADKSSAEQPGDGMGCHDDEPQKLKVI
jgi:integrase